MTNSSKSSNVSVEGLNATQLAEAVGLTWDVFAEPTYLMCGTTVHRKNSKKEAICVAHAILRNDLASPTRVKDAEDNGVMPELLPAEAFVGTGIGANYEIFTNKELCELILALADQDGITIDQVHGGALQGGQKVYISIDNGTHTGIGANNDTIKRYITAVNSHDGSTGLRFGSSNQVISCENQWFQVASQLGNKIKHTLSMADKVSAVLREIARIREEDDALYAMFDAMADQNVSTEQIDYVLEMVTKISRQEFSTGFKHEGTEQTETAIPQRSLNRYTTLEDNIKTEMEQKGSTLWGLFNGVTYYTTHSASSPNREGGEIESKMYGQNNRIDAKVLTYLKEQLTVTA